MRVPKKLCDDLRKYDYFVSTTGKSRFNGGRMINDATLKALIKEYKKGGDINSYNSQFPPSPAKSSWGKLLRGL